MGFRDFFSALPLISQVNPYHFYIKGYTEALKLYSDVRVVLDKNWLAGVPLDLQNYFYKVSFPCYFVPIFKDTNCYGFVLKGFTKMTPRFCTNALLPGCECLRGGELVVLCEGFKDSYLIKHVCKDLPVVVIPVLTAVPTRDLLVYLNSLGCHVLYVPDNDEHRQSHVARFYEQAGKVNLRVYSFCVDGIKDFGDFFNPDLRLSALSQGKRLRLFIKEIRDGS